MRDADIFGGGSETPAFRDAEIFADAVRAGAQKTQRLPTMRDSLKEEMAGKPVASAVAGFGSVLDNAALRLKQLVTGLNPQDQANVQANRDLVTANPAAYLGSIGGNAAVLGPIAGPSVVGNAAVGAGAGFMDPVVGNESAVGKAAMGGMFGAGGAAVGKLTTGSPVVQPSPQVRTMLQSGVVPTVGQAATASPNKLMQMLGRTEEKAMSIPLVGDIIGNSRFRAREEFNRAALNRAMPPGQTATAIGEQGKDLARFALGNAYDDIYKTADVKIDPQLLQGIAAAKLSPTVPMNGEGVKQFDSIMKNLLWDRLPQGQSMPAREAKMSIESDLGKAARQLKMSANSADKSVGDAVMNARDAFRDLMARNLPAGDAAKLSPVNQAYANYSDVKKAAERAKAQGGVFTPNQLQNATRSGTNLREFADAGQAVLGGRVPNSGTTDRALMAAILTPAGAAAYTGAPYLGLLGAAPLAYTRAGSRHLLGDLTPEPVQALSPYIAQGLAAHLRENNR
jgi:antitoxin component of MazEF toxin-antitoxin module